MRKNSFIFLFLCFIATASAIHAQVLLKGTVYDKVYMQPLGSVTVVSSMGNGTITDSMGRYAIYVRETDSVWFSYLNKPTIKFPIAMIANTEQFEIALHVPVTELKEVQVLPRNYKMDSLQNRREYAKIFNYQKPGLEISSPASGALGVGLDLTQLIQVFQFRKNRRMLALQQRLIQEEQDKYIDYRFTKVLIRKITGLEEPEISIYSRDFRPSYEWLTASTDYELAEYIKLTWLYFTGQVK